MRTRTTEAADFASTSLPRHLARGVVGFGGLIGSFALMPVVGPVSLLMLPVGAVALRGCPLCWTIGLVQTLSKGRLRRSCEDGQCKLTAVGREKHARDPG
ncbi:hypothetical protein AR457_32975 [Streptomyces agglomeratus]|uniref:Uncharacterized protein n=1 Tax=Streptomyces agglomeratus TaxID=285458 RepID=A0A1E5PGQ3_9ACTN|nr:hypothetical protein [Streptomyces agglomeratus]OEJ28564.1 hypothetical protein AS594_32890 [Streptomyces agglomeratus]OEJ37374.1 hypothetical protein BGK70_03690 [Streptomyces agglomeratus]OEJ48243.1 hypothetical protein AR457_32975 [Streptomyces agglomeratus]OEJ49915.1 hypothetical protein BGK72_03180 [Streptomyces agglomeratus]OEJ57243.1 hypothetical protein BGM19_03870 [Streptomyces agglomeratus]